jgi:hypothetical protein
MSVTLTATHRHVGIGYRPILVLSIVILNREVTKPLLTRMSMFQTKMYSSYAHFMWTYVT